MIEGMELADNTAPTPPPTTTPETPPTALPVSEPAGGDPAPPVAPPADPDPAPPAVEAAPPVEDRVPWPKWRKLRAEYETLEQRYRALEQEHTPVRERATTLERQLAEFEPLRSKAQDFDAMMDVLDVKPELRDAVLELLNTPGAVPARRTPARPGSAPAQPTTTPPALDPRVERVVSFVEQQAQREAQQRVSQEQARFNQQVAALTSKFLSERQYDPTLVLDPATKETLADSVIDYLVTEGARLNGGDLEDVPYLLNRWHARQQALLQPRIARYAAAKVQDNGLPASLPGGSPPAQIAEPPAAFGSKEFMERVRADMMRGGLGRTGTA